MSVLLENVRGKRVLLLNPPAAGTADVEERGLIATVEPIGLLRLGSWLRDRGAEVSLVDCLRDPGLEGRLRRHVRKRLRCGDDGEPPLEKEILHFGLDAPLLERRLGERPEPDLVAVSAIFTWQAEPVREAIASVRRVFPRARVVIGGNLTTLCPEVAAGLGADEVVAGDVPGADFAPTAVDLLPALPRTDYLRLVKGCPYQCSYCVTSVLNGGRVMARAPDEVLAEMKDKIARFGIRSFAFYDDFVLYRQERFLVPFLEAVAQEKLGVHLQFPLGLSAHAVDERLAALLRDAGVGRAELALETTSTSRARDMRRPQTLAQFRRAVEILRDHGFRGESLRGFYLVGLPDQTTEEILEAILWLCRLEVTPVITTYALAPRSGDWDRYADRVNGLALDDLAPELWRFASPAMRVRDLERIYRYFHERWYPVERILQSDTDDPVIVAMQRLAARC